MLGSWLCASEDVVNGLKRIKRKITQGAQTPRQGKIYMYRAYEEGKHKNNCIMSYCDDVT